MNSKLVIFKSEKEYFDVERLGYKQNTVREIEFDDVRKKIIDDYIVNPSLLTFIPLYIKIELVNSSVNFMRRVSHVCRYKGLYIISWREY